MNLVVVLVIGLVIVALGFWKVIAWSMVFWVIGFVATAYIVLWLAGRLFLWLQAQFADARRAGRNLIDALRSLPDRGKTLWAALPFATKAVVAGTAAGISVAVVVGGTYMASGSTVIFHRFIVGVSPMLVAWTNSEPAYNVLLSPQFEGRADNGTRSIVVRAGAATRLSFGISPQWLAASVVKARPDTRITRSDDDVALTVTLTCDFCAPHDAFIEQMIYRPSRQSSNFVEFDFVPLARDTPAGGRVHGRLVLSVMHTSTAQEYDRIPIQVLIDPGTPSAEADARVALAADVKSSLAGKHEKAADVLLLLFEHQDHQVRVQIQPVRPELARALRPYVYDATGEPRRFITRVFGQSDIQAMTTAGYTRISELSLQGPLAARLTGVTISKKSRTTSKLEAHEARGVREAIALTGQTLYRKLFVDFADSALADAIELLESYEEKNPGSAPLRVLIQTDLALPWQYMYPVGGAAVDGKKFWGMRFNLAVERTRFEVPGLPNTAGAKPPRKVVFAKYALVSDESAPFADTQIGMLKDFSDVEVVDSKERFLAALSGQRERISAIVTFLHASSTDRQATHSNVSLAPRLHFAQADSVAVDELEGLLNKLERKERQQEPRYLRGAPLVILNACESGPSTLALSHLTLENMMFKLGAQGVVATEVPVWIPLANEVGKRLISRLREGETASQALTAIRRELDENFDNPLGLLYAYYGGPAAGLRP